MAWSVFVLDFSPRAKRALLVLLAVLAGATTVTNGLLPVILLLMTFLPKRPDGAPWSPRASWIIGIVAIVLAAAIGAFLFGEQILEFLQRRLGLMYLHGRLFRDPLSALLYALRGLFDPVIAPVPQVVNADMPGEAMLTLEPFDWRWPYDRYQSVPVAAWGALLTFSVVTIARDPTVWHSGGALLAWLAINAVGHNLWGDEHFLFSPHWSWCLIALILVAARRWSSMWLVPVLVIVMAGQVYSLWIMHESLAAILQVG
jgi:hypothetical protein